MSEGSHIPQAVLAALEQVLARYLSLDPEGAQRLAPMYGRVICIEIRGFGTRLYFIPGTTGIQVYGDYAAQPDCIMRGSLVALARMGLTSHKEDSLFSGQVQVEGDTDLAQEFGDLVGGLDPDWEEQLARMVGDPIAHQVGNQVRAAGRWGRRSLDTLAADVTEYLQEEQRILPTRYELNAFLNAVDTLRDDTERLAARVERLRNRSESSG